MQEFVSDPVDGTVLLLELLRSIQLNDTQHQGKVTPSTHRRALLDENSCLQCLQYCLRCEETTRRLSMSSIGLFTLAVCIMSSVSKSRIISLEVSYTNTYNVIFRLIRKINFLYKFIFQFEKSLIFFFYT